MDNKLEYYREQRETIKTILDFLKNEKYHSTLIDYFNLENSVLFEHYIVNGENGIETKYFKNIKILLTMLDIFENEKYRSVLEDYYSMIDRILYDEIKKEVKNGY